MEASAAQCTGARFCQSQIVTFAIWRTKRYIIHWPALVERRKQIIMFFDVGEANTTIKHTQNSHHFWEEPFDIAALGRIKRGTTRNYPPVQLP